MAGGFGLLDNRVCRCITRGRGVRVFLGFAQHLLRLVRGRLSNLAELCLFFGEDTFSVGHQLVAVLPHIAVLCPAAGQCGPDGGPNGERKRTGDQRLLFIHINGTIPTLAAIGGGCRTGTNGAFTRGNDALAGLL